MNAKEEIKSPKEIVENIFYTNLPSSEEDKILFNAKDMYKAMEAYHAQFQPTEKTREDIIKLLIANGNKNWGGIADALIQSGYIQSDSVDAEQAFEELWKQEESTNKFFILFPNEKEEVKKDMKRIFLAGSKVKPVNEITEALKGIESKDKETAIKAFVKVCNDPIPEGKGKEYLFGMIKMKAFLAGRCFQVALSTAPEINHPDK